MGRGGAEEVISFEVRGGLDGDIISDDIHF
jgi:hypothetical protein